MNQHMYSRDAERESQRAIDGRGRYMVSTGCAEDSLCVSVTFIHPKPTNTQRRVAIMAPPRHTTRNTQHQHGIDWHRGRGEEERHAFGRQAGRSKQDTHHEREKRRSSLEKSLRAIPERHTRSNAKAHLRRDPRCAFASGLIGYSKDDERGTLNQ